MIATVRRCLLLYTRSRNTKIVHSGSGRYPVHSYRSQLIPFSVISYYCQLVPQLTHTFVNFTRTFDIFYLSWSTRTFYNFNMYTNAYLLVLYSEIIQVWHQLLSTFCQMNPRKMILINWCIYLYTLSLRRAFVSRNVCIIH